MPVEHLDHASDHLTDLVIQEALPFQIESHELNTVGVLFICHFECLGVDVPELASIHVHHEPLGGHLVRFHFFSVVVVFTGADKAAP